MNRRKFFFRSLVASTLVLVGSQVFISSCKKNDPVDAVSNHIDAAAISNLNSAIIGSATLAALPADILNASVSITTFMTQAEVDTYSTVDLNLVIQLYKNNNVISSDEKTKLLANDPATLSAILNRMFAMPSFTTELSVSKSSDTFSNNAQLSSYSSNDTAGNAELYSGQYYQCALDQQAFIRDNTIPKMEKILALKTIANKSASTVGSTLVNTPSDRKIIALLMVLSLAELHELSHVILLMRGKLATLHVGG